MNKTVLLRFLISFLILTNVVSTVHGLGGRVRVVERPKDIPLEKWRRGWYGWSELVQNKKFEDALYYQQGEVEWLPPFLPFIIRTNNADFVEQALRKSYCDFSDNYYSGALCEATARGYTKIFYQLDYYDKRKPEESDTCYATCLMIACAGGFFDIMSRIVVGLAPYRYSLAKGFTFDINRGEQIDFAKLEFDFTGIGRKRRSHWRFQPSVGAKKGASLALHAAVDGNHLDCVLFLLANGADSNKGDHDGETALAIAERRNLLDIIRVLKLFERYKPLITKIGYTDDNHPWTHKLLQACPALASLYIKGDRGSTLLHAAVWADDPVLVATVLRMEPRLFFEKDAQGWIPLECAIASGNHNALKSILRVAYEDDKKGGFKVIRGVERRACEPERVAKRAARREERDKARQEAWERAGQEALRQYREGLVGQ